MGGPGGPGGPRDGFGPGGILGSAALEQGDADRDGSLSTNELERLGEAWWARLNPKGTASLRSEAFGQNLNEVLPPPPGFGPPGGGPGGGGRFGPGLFLGSPFFAAADADHNGELAREEWKERFAGWGNEWDRDHSGTLSAAEVREGFQAIIVITGGPGRPGGPGGPGVPGGPGGPGGGPMFFGRSSPMAEALFGRYANEMDLNFLWFLWYLLVFLTLAPAVWWGLSRGVKLAGDGATTRLARWGAAGLRWGGLALVPSARDSGRRDRQSKSAVDRNFRND